MGFDDPRGSNKAQGLSPAVPWGLDYAPKDATLSALGDARGAIVHAWRGGQAWCSSNSCLLPLPAQTTVVALLLIRP